MRYERKIVDTETVIIARWTWNDNVMALGKSLFRDTCDPQNEARDTCWAKLVP